MTNTAAVLLIGNELLSGQIQDQNLAYIATRLTAFGIPVIEARVVADTPAAIIAAVKALASTYTYVFTTGGIGPTHDDITAQAMADAFEAPLVEHAEALARLTAYYGSALNGPRRRMAMIPKGATLIDNPISQSPGFHLRNVYVMAGVPQIMQAMLETVLPTLGHGAPINTQIVTCYKPEGDIAEALAQVQSQFPTVNIGSYPNYRDGKFRVNLVLRSQDPEALAQCLAQVEKIV